jgi:hypothetical protein
MGVKYISDTIVTRSSHYVPISIKPTKRTLKNTLSIVSVLMCSILWKIEINMSCITVDSAFVGPVLLHLDHPSVLRGSKVYELSSHIEGLNGGLALDVITYDVREYSSEEIDVMRMVPGWMDALTPVLIDVDECAGNTRIIADTGSSKEAVLRAVRYNNAVDSHFFACNFVTFMRQVVHVQSISRSTTVSVLYGTRDCNNAAYYGEGVLMIGAGTTSAYPFGTIDIIAHELGHGLVSNTPQKGEAGAIQEHFADFVATSFESYMCKTHQQLPVFDYLIGEDRDPRNVIRNMAEPWRQRHPRAYGGWYWRNPASDVDNGFIHVNCAVGNYCFYHFSMLVGMDVATQIFLNVMYRTPTTYAEYGRLLQVYAQSAGTMAPMNVCLQKCGLLPKSARGSWCTLL